MKYYSGIYQDGKGRVFQVCDDIDCMSCEVLADPGVCLSSDFHSVGGMIAVGRTVAHFLMCSHLEVNLSNQYNLVSL